MPGRRTGPINDSYLNMKRGAKSNEFVFRQIPLSTSSPITCAVECVKSGSSCNAIMFDR